MVCKRLYGITLVELVVSLAIISILTLLVVPSFIDLTRSAHLSTQTNLFLSALQFSRSEAIKRHVKVFVCAGSNGVCSGKPQWEEGWTVFVDENGDTKPSAGELIRSFQALAEGYILKPNVKAVSLEFWPDGQVRRGSGGLPLMTFQLCSPDAGAGDIRNRAREIVVSQTGRARVRMGRLGKTKCS